MAVLAVLAVAVLALAAVGVRAALRGLGGRAEVPVAEVVREDFVRRVVAEGNLEATEATVLSAPIAIEMPVKIAWLAEDGSHVKEGDVVVRFDPTDFEKELADGEADRSSAQSKIQQATVTSESTLKNLDRDAEMAGRELDYAREFQSKDEDIFSRSDIIESEIDELLATERQSHAVDSRGIHEELSQVELDLLDIEKRKAQIKIDKAETGLDSLELVAPHDGILVLEERWDGPMTVGAMVWRGNPVAELPRLEEMEAKVYVLEADAGGLTEGLSATVRLEAHPGHEFAATVKQVDALPSRRVRWSPVQYFAVKLELETTDPELMKPGGRVVATLTFEELEGVLTVPREALFEQEGKKIVYCRNGSGFEEVEVTVGPGALGRVVIEEGLAEGDRVALRDPSRRVDDDSAVDEGTAGPSANGTGLP
jgi:RND family efflux transporter MFP subunit